MYIKRILEKDIKEGAKYFPVVAILGPRQSGKTTLAKKIFNKYTYVSLEEVDKRQAAQNDPRTFLAQHANTYGLVIDEFQHVPDLLSYIQTIVDEKKQQGFFILTGSQNFLMNLSISQSLAGRVSLHTLLPLSIDELQAAKLLPDEIEQALYQGFYPATYTKNTPHGRLYSQYVRTYIERDVRLLAHVGDLATFQTFLRLCAERVGQRVNFTELGKECGISDQTAHRWLTILEASYIVYLLRPYEKTVSKQMIKGKKLFFYDSGLVCYLLNLTHEDLIDNPKKGNIFESLVISELLKQFYNRGIEPSLFYWLDKNNHEVDCIINYGKHLVALEIKASRTMNTRFFSGLLFWKTLDHATIPSCYVIYAGSKKQVSGYREVISWQSLKKVMAFLD